MHASLDARRLPHAFGGAIALAYCTLEPRGTRDLDVNVFVDASRAAEVLAALPSGVAYTESDVAATQVDGQVRVWWDDTPVDVFLDVHTFHQEAAAGIRVVPFAGTEIPVLGCTALAVFKVVFNRTKDWADIEEMVGAGSLDGAATLGWVARLFGTADPRTRRLAKVVG